MTEFSKLDGTIFLPSEELIRCLRQIGWDLWDPIGIRSVGDDAWEKNAADEYDRYLFHIADMLQQGKSVDEAAAYLDRVATEWMGLGPGNEATYLASKATATAVSAYISSLSGNT